MEVALAAPAIQPVPAHAPTAAGPIPAITPANGLQGPGLVDPAPTPVITRPRRARRVTIIRPLLPRRGDPKRPSPCEFPKGHFVSEKHPLGNSIQTRTLTYHVGLGPRKNTKNAHGPLTQKELVRCLHCPLTAGHLTTTASGVVRHAQRSKRSTRGRLRVTNSTSYHQYARGLVSSQLHHHARKLVSGRLRPLVGGHG